MKKNFFLQVLFLSLLFLFFFAEATAQEDVYDYESLTLNITISNEIVLSSSATLKAKLFSFPLTDERQQPEEMKTSSFPQANVEKEENITFSWSNVDRAEFSVNSIVKTKVKWPSSFKIDFPLKINEYEEYKKQSENIDINDEIIKKANEVVAGKKDMLKALFALAEFINSNMKYDMAYEKETEKASVVLKNMKGVCDEYTVLFIALARSLGIPARYVSGVAYSNIDKNFGNHAWAEVFIPEHGWLPFDATYGQYAWIDASHIALAKGIDTENNILYSYTAKNIDAGELKIKTEVLEKGEKIKPMTELKIETVKNYIRPLSFLPLRVEIKNLQQHYLPLSIYLTMAPGVYGKNNKQIMLAPEETRNEFFILQIPKGEQGYRYESKIGINSSDNNNAETRLFFSQAYEEGFTLEGAKSLVEALTEMDEKFLPGVELECKPEKTEFYEDEEKKALCKAINNGNIFLQGLNLCVEECKSFDLAIGKEREETFILKNKTSYIAKLSNEQIEKKLYFSIRILKRPDIKIISVEPEEIDYYSETLKIKLYTKSECKNLSLVVNNAAISTEKIEGEEEINLEFAGKYALKEEIKIKASCYDLQNSESKDEKIVNVKIKNMPFYAKIWQIFIKLFSKL